MGLGLRQRARDRFCARPDEVTVTIPWRAPVRQMLAMSAYLVCWGRLTDLGPASSATMSGIVAMTSVGGDPLSRSTFRHRVLVISNFVVLIAVPFLTVRLLPGAYRHEWYATYAAAFATMVLAVYAYVALSRRPGYGPLELPMEKPEQAVLVGQLWTPGERVARLGTSGRTVFRRAYPIVFNTPAFAFLTFVSLGVAAALLGDHAWAGGGVAAALCLFFGRTTVRALRVAVVADADGIIVRNLQWTYRVAWVNVRQIVPPSADVYRYLRIDRVHGGRVRCAALSKNIFQRRRALDRYADELAFLAGPRPEAVQVGAPLD